MSLYRIVEVPDPTGQLADLLSELIDNSVLVEADPDYEAAAKEVDAFVAYIQHEGRGYMAGLAAKLIVNAALGVDPPEET